MQGEINMGGFKITNLGQTNLQGKDAVNYNTLTTTVSTDQLASDGIFGRPAVIPSYTVIPKPSAFTPIQTPFIVSLVPGTMFDFGIAETNWVQVLEPNVPSMVLTSNNIPGSFSAVKLSTKFILQFESTDVQTLTVSLLVFNISNGVVVASQNMLVPQNSQDVNSIDLQLAISSGLALSNLGCVLMIEVPSTTTVFGILLAQLLQFCYLFTN